MMRKLTILLSGAVGYVLGTRAGRERYEQIKGMASKVKDVGSGDDSLEEQLHPDSTARQDDPYPKGDLP